MAESALRAPIGGLVVTNKIEDKAGSDLHPGEAFGEIVAQEHMAAEMSVPETDLSLVKPGAKTALKLNAFPTITFQGTVDQLGAQTHAEAGDQYFMLRSTFDNVDDRARIGMAGRARISAGGGWFGSGWYPVGYVLLRPPVRWLWEKVGSIYLEVHGMKDAKQFPAICVALAALSIVNLALSGCSDSSSHSEAAAPATPASFLAGAHDCATGEYAYCK